jgi:hypothetical protein
MAMEGRAAVAWIADRRWICVVPLALTAALTWEDEVAARPPEPEVARCIREAARWIFLDALKRSGSYWKAVGIYHSPNGIRQRRYAAQVAVHLQKRFGSDVFGSRKDVQARSVP